jgi:hypothetical protein
MLHLGQVALPPLSTLGCYDMECLNARRRWVHRRFCCAIVHERANLLTAHVKYRDPHRLGENHARAIAWVLTIDLQDA